jgi:hypothetical protein
MSTEPTIYRASGQFVTAYRAFQDQYRAFAATIKAYNDANPEHPAALTRGNLSLNVSVRGFKDTNPRSPVPDGLSRKQGRDYLIPVRGPRGQKWRDEIAAISTPPSVEALYNAHGFDTFVIGHGGMYTAGVEDCGEHGVFVKIGEPFPRPSEHLALVPLSEYYRAREASEDAADREVADSLIPATPEKT